ncbi:hypothetical protein ELQ92_01845 [Labedella populi]|uniref:Uncharacterized protein n=1 Tax=Labedella populi TaxID=2498850 RepID=A0A3S5CP54_9MICO|nr:hypothetical protein [Labedella populi]RWZ68023.1 hypothetical protein ELQ92_01845 [Labedella populi]
MASTGVRRVARGSAAAAVSTFVALLSHVAADGAAPTLVGVSVPLVLSLAVCTVLAGRRLALPRLVASVVVSQVLFHALFVLGAPGDVRLGDGATESGSHLHTVVLTSSVAHDHGGGPTMWWAHAVAAAVTVVALSRGEAAARRVLSVGRLVVTRFATGRLARARSIRPLGFRRTARPPVPVYGRTACPRRSAPLLSRRGPPFPSTAV